MPRRGVAWLSFLLLIVSLSVAASLGVAWLLSRLVGFAFKPLLVVAVSAAVSAASAWQLSRRPLRG